MAKRKTTAHNRMASFDAAIKKAMGEDWYRLTPDDRKTVRELSKCQKGGGRPPSHAEEE